MAARKHKFSRVTLVGTGLNETLLVSSHEIISYPSSTYHKFTYPNGAIQYKNDFGVSSVTLLPIEMTDEELRQAGF